MCALTILLLVFPGTRLDVVWKLKSEARDELLALGIFAILLMMVVGAACSGAAIGLINGAEWGRRLGILVLGVNIIGDLANAVLRADWRTLIGLPIGGLMIVYLMRARVNGRWKEGRAKACAR